MVRFVLPLLCLTLFALICGCVSAVGKITVDPNTGGLATPKVVTDARLPQKVTYEASYVPVQQILEDLTTMTGIKLYAGSSKSDWQVRSRKMNIFVKDVKLSDLMNSIAHVMKFKWSRNDDVNPPTYRLVVDKKVAAAADAQVALAKTKFEEIWQKRRNEWIDAIMKYGSKSPSEIELLRQTNVVVHRYARYGVAQALRALFTEVPETKSRFAAGRAFRISSDKLSDQTADLLYSAGNGYWKYLQKSGQVCEAQAEPVGYGDIFKSDDVFDIALIRMDETEGFTPGLRWGGTTQLSCGYFHLMKNGREFEMADLRAINEDWSKSLSEWNNWVLDGRPSQTPDGGDRHYTKLMEDLKKQEELLYPSEPLNEHPANDEFEKNIKLITETPHTDQNPELVIARYIAIVQKAFADATGLGIVSDSWANIQGDRRIPVKEGKLSELLEKFSTKYNYNWDKSSTILEFRHRKWWKNRLNQFSDDRVTAWSENTKKNGVLSLDDLAQISNLTYDQAEESLKPDKVLGTAGIYRQIVEILDRNICWLRLYSTLSPQLRALLIGQDGINGHMLTSAQWKVAQTLFDRIGVSRGDALFLLKQEPNDKETIYKFREIDNETGEEDRMWRIQLPRCDPPKK